MLPENRSPGAKAPVDLPPPPGARFFDPLTWHIEQFFHSGKPPYPVERTLLTSGVVTAGLTSLAQGKRLETPHLAVKYEVGKESLFART